jgi:predicted Zn-dependent protease
MISGCSKQRDEVKATEKLEEEVAAKEQPEEDVKIQEELEEVEEWVEEELARAESYILDGKYVKAISLLNRLKRQRPDNAKLYYLLGRAYEALGNDQMSIEAYMKALELDPEISKKIKRPMD